MEDETKLKNLEREQDELRHMINQGLSFDINVSYSLWRPTAISRIQTRETVSKKLAHSSDEP